MARILILDGHSPAALAFTRALGRAGHWVAVGSAEGTLGVSTLSRHCRSGWEYPAPTGGPARFIETLIDFVRGQGIDLVVPISDVTTWPLSRMRGRFSGLSALAVPPHEALELAADKHRTILLAREAGVPAPESLLARSVDDLIPAREWSFPIVVKDRSSMRWLDNRGVPGSVAYAYSWEDLRGKVERSLARAGDVLVQRYHAGTGIGFSCFIAGERTYLPFQWRRVREKDPRGSGSSARRSVPLDPQVTEYSQSLLRRIGFQGIAMVEFKQDVGSGALSLMEINGRPWGSLQLPIHCGIDYPCQLVRWLLDGRTPPETSDYTAGLTSRSLSADLIHLENVWGGRPDGWPVTYPNFWSTLLAVSVPWHPGMRYDDLSLRDLRPGLVELGRWFRAHLWRRG